MARGHIHRKPNGNYVLIWDAPRGLDGRRRQRTVTLACPRRDAERELARRVAEAKDEAANPERLTVGQWCSRWLTEYAAHSVSPRTLQGYEQVLKLRVSPNIGHVPLDELLPMDVQRLYARLLANGGKNGKSLSARSVLHAHRVLHLALRHAVDLGVLDANPASKAKPPRPKERHFEVLTESEAFLLLAASKGTVLHVVLAMAIGLGLRRGEILAATFSSYSPPRYGPDGSLLSHGHLVIDKSLEQTRAGGLRVKPPKSRRGHRVVSVPAFLARVIDERREQVTADKARLGDEYRDHDLIACLENGDHYPPDTCSSNAKQFFKRHRHPDKSLHSLRHAHASWLCRTHWLTAADGVTTFQAPPLSVRAIADRLGHDPSVSLAVYQHSMAAATDPAVTKLDALFAANGN